MAYAPKTDWKTSKGRTVPDLHLTSADFTLAEKATIKQGVESQFPGAVVVADASRAFNCHGYAHAKAHAWFNEVQLLIDDDYEPFTPSQLQVDDVVVYVDSGVITHSGIIKSLSGNIIDKVRSKWGNGPQVLHSTTNVPGEYGSITHYLRKRSLFREPEKVRTALAIEEVNDLIYQLKHHPSLRRLLFASTPEAAILILSRIPQVVSLRLYGAAAEELLLREFEASSGVEELALAYALGTFATQAARAGLATRVSRLSNEVDPIRDYVLIAAYLSSKRDLKDFRAATIAAAAEEVQERLP